MLHFNSGIVAVRGGEQMGGKKNTNKSDSSTAFIWASAGLWDEI